EVNGSTIVRGALDELFNKLEEEKKEVAKISLPLANTEKEELEETLNVLQIMLDSVDKKNLTSKTAKNTIAVIELLKIKIKGKLIDIIY
ncbi:MAG: hypothetical protein ACRC68_06530, partial [Clostridium sp.]